MEKKTQIILLETKDSTHRGIWKDVNNKLFFHNGITSAQRPNIPMHIYVCSEEEIKEGDWFAVLDRKTLQVNSSSTFANTIHRCTEVVNGNYAFDGGFVGKDHHLFICLKVIATKDSSLGDLQQIMPGSTGLAKKSLPSIPETFIEQHITRYNEGNPIKEVMVEYETIHADLAPNGWETLLKLNGNEIIISIPEEKLYTRAEVEELMTDLMDGDYIHTIKCRADIFTYVKDWLNKNL